MFIKLSLSQKIAFTAVFAALSIAFNIVQINIPGVITISFSYIPTFLAAILFGPVYGMAVGFVGDLLGTLINGWAVSLIILLGNTLIGAIMGAVFCYKKINNSYIKIAIGAILVLIIVTMGINTYGLTVPPAKSHPDFSTAFIKRLLQIPILAFNTAIVMALYPLILKIYFKKFNKAEQ